MKLWELNFGFEANFSQEQLKSWAQALWLVTDESDSGCLQKIGRCLSAGLWSLDNHFWAQSEATSCLKTGELLSNLPLTSVIILVYSVLWCFHPCFYAWTLDSLGDSLRPAHALRLVSRYRELSLSLYTVIRICFLRIHCKKCGLKPGMTAICLTPHATDVGGCRERHGICTHLVNCTDLSTLTTIQRQTVHYFKLNEIYFALKICWL